MKSVEELEGGGDCRLEPCLSPGVDVLVYSYGCRIDKEAQLHVNDQVSQARVLYNNIVACLRSVHAAAETWVLERASDHARSLAGQIEQLSEAYAAAKAANDEAARAAVAQARTTLRKELSTELKAVRKEHKASINALFWSRIGTGKACDTYQLRCAAVDAGLGWGTANDILARALTAWKKSMVRGRPPEFARGSEIDVDTLSIQFTTKGGLPLDRVLDGKNTEVSLTTAPRGPGQGRKIFGELRFRLGRASEQIYATGTWEFHRPFPAGEGQEVNVSSVRLVRKRAANKFKYTIQLVLTLKNSLRIQTQPTKQLACVHFGWAADVEGRRVAAIADTTEPSAARLIQLPTDIELDLERAAQIQSERDTRRDEVVSRLRDIVELERLSDGLAAEVKAMARLKPQWVAIRRFYILQRLLGQEGVELAWLNDFVREDRKRWQATVGLARSARARRQKFYQGIALDLARTYSAVVIEPLDLAAAAQKFDESTGERGEFGPKARAGRTVAALYEFESAIRWACAKAKTAVFEFQGQSVTTCAHCGSGDVVQSPGDHRLLRCNECGAEGDRKQSGAARVYQLSAGGMEDLIVDFHQAANQLREDLAVAKAERKRKMAEGRSKARAVRKNEGGGEGSGLTGAA